MSEFEASVREDLVAYLRRQGELGERLPEAADIEQKWESVARSYMPDGVREFADYPVASLGWMMYVGMAVARFWDLDWEHYAGIGDVYAYLRDQWGYDRLDEYVRSKVLLLDGDDFEAAERLVSECASRTYSQLQRQRIEPGTVEALQAYVDCLRQLYLMGAFVQLHRMGYRMTRVR